MWRAHFLLAGPCHGQEITMVFPKATSQHIWLRVCCKPLLFVVKHKTPQKSLPAVAKMQNRVKTEVAQNPTVLGFYILVGESDKTDVAGHTRGRA